MQTNSYPEGRMTLWVTPAGWVVKHEGRIGTRVVELFGVDTLPLPYTPAAAAETVLAEVRARNPLVQVQLAGEVL